MTTKSKRGLGNDAPAQPVPAAPAAPVAPIILKNEEKLGVAGLLVRVGVGAGLLWAGKKFIYDPWVKKGAADKLGTSPAGQAASIIWDAKGTWFTVDHEDKAIDAAKQIAQMGVAWKDVSDAFTAAHPGRNIADYLDSFMSAEEKQLFFNTLNLTQSTKTDPKTGQPTKPIKSQQEWVAGKAVVTTASAVIRKSPRWTDSMAKTAVDNFINPFGNKKSNYIVVVDSNVSVGTATGKTSFDEKAQPVGVLYVEVKTNLYDDKDKAIGAATVWVAASQATQKWFKEIISYDSDPNGKMIPPYKALHLKKSAYDAAATLSGPPAVTPKTGFLFTNNISVIRNAPIEGNNILQRMGEGRFVGRATGRVQLDNVGRIAYREVRIPTLDKGKKLLANDLLWLHGWIPAADVRDGSFQEAMNLPAENWLLITYDEYVKSIHLEKAVGAPNFMKEIIAQQDTDVLSLNMTKVATAKKGLVLGHFVKYLKSGNTLYYLVQTIQQQYRWVNSANVRVNTIGA